MKHEWFKKYLWGITCLVLGACLSGMAFAQLSSSMSTDQVLQYSMDSLRTKMDSAVNENRKLSAKNSSIRSRVLFLKKEMRELDDEIIGLKEHAVDIKNAVKLEAKELKVDDKHFNSILERKRHLMFERDTLKKRIESLRIEREMLEQDIDGAVFDVQGLKGSLTGPVSSNLLDFYSDEKVGFLDMFKDSRARAAEKRNTMDMLELQIADALRQKEQALRQQESLERTLKEWELQSKEAAAETELLERVTRKWEQDLKEGRRLNEKRNEVRRRYRNQLTAVIQDMEAARQNIKRQFDRDQEEMGRYVSLLGNENEMLFQYKGMLEDAVFLQQKQEAERHTTLVLTEQEREQQDMAGLLIKEKQEVQDKIADQKKINESFKRDEVRLQGGLRDLADQVEKVKRSVAVTREDAFGQKKRELERAMEEQNARVQKLAGEISLAKESIQQFSQKNSVVRQQVASLQNDLQEAESNIKDLEQRHKDLLEQGRQFLQLADQNLAAFRQGIAHTRMRKKALEASFDVVQKKYQISKDETAAFEAERAELERYLGVLKKENLSLQQKFKDLGGE